MDGAPRLTNSDVAALTAWRRHLHAHPEISGAEAATAANVAAALADTGPDKVMTGLGGHGVAAVFEGRSPGPSLMFRCELDALPIEETGDLPHRSTVPGAGHLCGHDGHMAILGGVARALSRTRPAQGRVVLLFQPAEENGSGAAAVIGDPAWSAIAPDFAFALHNMPGVPVGRALLAEGVVNCASRGLRIRLTGRTAHASEPEKGISPMPALARLMPALSGLGTGGTSDKDGGEFSLVTVTHAQMGAAAFGIAPGEAELWATLRTRTDAAMAALVAAAEGEASAAAKAAGLGLEITYHDVFSHCENAAEATAILARALDATGIRHAPGDLPMRASEDFGRFGQGAAAAMVFLGAGNAQPPLHAPDYDFPDALIPIGSRLFLSVIGDMLGF